jgi:hypothetical protein
VGWLSRCLLLSGWLGSEWPARQCSGHGVARKRREHFLHQECPRGSHPDHEEVPEVEVLIGVDPHKRSHHAVAIDRDETRLAELSVRAAKDQTQRLLAWAARFPERRWAIESAGGLGYLLSQQLVGAGEEVLDVPATLAARVRVLGSGALPEERSQRRPLHRHRCPAPPGAACSAGRQLHGDPADAGDAPPRPRVASHPDGLSAPRSARRPHSRWVFGPVVGQEGGGAASLGQTERRCDRRAQGPGPRASRRPPPPRRWHRRGEEAHRRGH